MAEDKAFVSFICQRCSQSLKLDDSLNSFSEHISAELNLPIHSNIDVDLESQAISFDHYVPPCRLSDSRNPTSGFMLISDENEVDLLSHQFKAKAALFDHLSGTSTIDHPLCEECTDCLIEILEQELDSTQRDFDDYCQYYKVLQQEKTEPKLADFEKELSSLTEEESRLLEELAALKKEEEDTVKEIEEQEKISKKITQEENKYWKEYVRHKREWLVAEDEARSLKCQLATAQAHLDKLKRTNVFNATFHIWHKGHFGTINNFCLGTLPSAPVSWQEINTAWGQTCLLLCALARKINLTFERYRCVPYGSHSYLEVFAENNRKVPLYGSGGPKYLWDMKFDVAMMGFLDCLQQLTEKVEELEKNNRVFRFPYRISNGKIEDSDNVKYILRVTIMSEEQWTKALKFMLTNLKWGLAWVASQFDSNGEEVPPLQN
ncbi:beclin-1-like protein [Anthonomus grandis grandis]|uniref:beclin-1-like protein n=1 Tax=Anthonomus grandis grandis TaxID=2921223 RepID=UPI0021654C42|nr:beclin-1-like protein [Anthonomus grandis grandis]